MKATVKRSISPKGDPPWLTGLGAILVGSVVMYAVIILGKVMQ